MKPNWRQAILYITTAGIEACWLYILFIMLNGLVADGGLSVTGLLLIYPVAFGFNVLLRWLKWHKVFQYSTNTLLWVIGMLLMIKFQLFSYLPLSDTAWLLALPQAIANIFNEFEPELLILLSSAAIWWLGRRLAYTRINFSTSVTEFQFGLGILLIVLFIASELKVQLVNSIPIVLGFFLFALLGISIAHAQEEKSWLTELRQGHWLGILLICICLILILGLVIGSVITPDLIQQIWSGIKWLLSMIERAIMFLLNLLPQPDMPEEIPSDWEEPAFEPPEGSGGFTIPGQVTSVFRLVWNILVVGLTFLFLWRASAQIFGWLRRKLAHTSGAEVESLHGAFKADLLNLLRRILLKLLSFKLPFRWGKKPEPQEITSVRQLYRRLLHWAATHGWPRPTYQTPYEYLYALEKALPESGEALHRITQHYVSARYGLSPPSEEELRQLRQSWHQVKHQQLRHPDSKTRR